MNRQQKSIVFLSIVSIMLLLQFSFSERSYGWHNVPYEFITYSPDRLHDRVYYYLFGEDPTTKLESSQYGEHDWIADSAIHLLLSRGYSSAIRWLFDFSLNIPFKDFDQMGWNPTSTRNLLSTSRKWFNRESYTHPDNGIIMSEEQWMMGRRYMWYLFGTEIPDRHTALTISDIDIPGERVKAYAGKWTRTSTHTIHFGRNDQETDWIKGHVKPLTYVYEAAYKAVQYLNYKVNNENHPKFEAAAYCLGGAVHFIADSAVTAHVHDSRLFPIKHYGQGADRGWENEGVNLARFSFNDNGPDWSLLNPLSELIKPPIVQIMSPQAAMEELAYRTFTGYDIEPEAKPNLGKYSVLLPSLNENYDKNNEQLGVDNYEEYWQSLGYLNYEEARTLSIQRLRNLLSQSVYYSANVILWVCSKIDPEVMKQINGDPGDPENPPPGKGPINPFNDRFREDENFIDDEGPGPGSKEPNTSKSIEEALKTEGYSTEPDPSNIFPRDSDDNARMWDAFVKAAPLFPIEGAGIAWLISKSHQGSDRDLPF